MVYDPLGINPTLRFDRGALLPSGWNLQAPGVTQSEIRKLIQVHDKGEQQPTFIVSYSQIGWYMWRAVPALNRYPDIKMVLSAKIRSNAPVYIQCGNLVEKHKSRKHTGNNQWETLSVVFYPSNKMNEIIIPVVHVLPRSRNPPKYVQVEVGDIQLLPLESVIQQGVTVELPEADDVTVCSTRANSAPMVTRRAAQVPTKRNASPDPRPAAQRYNMYARPPPVDSRGGAAAAVINTPHGYYGGPNQGGGLEAQASMYAPAQLARAQAPGRGSGRARRTGHDARNGGDQQYVRGLSSRRDQPGQRGQGYGMPGQEKHLGITSYQEQEIPRQRSVETPATPGHMDVPPHLHTVSALSGATPEPGMTQPPQHTNVTAPGNLPPAEHAARVRRLSPYTSPEDDSQQPQYQSYKQMKAALSAAKAANPSRDRSGYGPAQVPVQQHNHPSSSTHPSPPPAQQTPDINGQRSSRNSHRKRDGERWSSLMNNITHLSTLVQSKQQLHDREIVGLKEQVRSMGQELAQIKAMLAAKQGGQPPAKHSTAQQGVAQDQNIPGGSKEQLEGQEGKSTVQEVQESAGVQEGGKGAAWGPAGDVAVQGTTVQQ